MTGDFMTGDFLTRDFLSPVEHFGDFMSRDFLTGDFLTWIHRKYIYIINPCLKFILCQVYLYTDKTIKRNDKTIGLQR